MPVCAIAALFCCGQVLLETSIARDKYCYSIGRSRSRSLPRPMHDAGIEERTVMTLSRRSKLALSLASLLILALATGLVALLNMDWNRAKPWLNERISGALGRPFAIHGDLALTWHGAIDATADARTGWRKLVPWPHLVAQDVHLGNPIALTTEQPVLANNRAPAAALPAEMARVAGLAFSLDPLALLDKRIAIPELRFSAPVIFLQRTSDGKNNWTFKNSATDSPWQLDLQKVVFSKGSVRLLDALQRADLRAEIDTVEGDARYSIAWKLSGQFNGDPVAGSGKAGAVLSLQRQTEPYAVAAQLKIGPSAIAIEGTLTKPAALAALDMRLKVSGSSMARLYALTGLVLPETPPFATEGHLTGELGKNSSHWFYDRFTGKVGSSDIAGKLDYRAQLPRGVLSGVIGSRQLAFADLAPVVGADSRASKAARGANQAQPTGRVLPVEPFKTERWTSIDADVTYTAATIVRGQDLPISNLSTHVLLKDGVLSLLPLNFDIAGGTLATNIKLDGSGKIDHQVIRAELKASAREIALKQMFPRLEKMQASAGELNADASLSATGNSVASLLGSANGEIKTLVNQGTISKLLLEEMGLNVGNIVIAKLFGDKQVKLNCMTSDFAVSNGLMQTRSFIVDTEEAVLHVSGEINLANERLDLTLKPDTRGWRVFSLRSPLYLTGTFAKPDVSVDKKILGLRAGGAIALAVVAPIAALLPLVNTGPDHVSNCGSQLASARIAPVAPPPGTSVRRQR